MGCDDVRRVIYFFLDGTLSEARKQDIESHFGRCPECGQRATISKRLRAFVKRRVARMEAPQRFKVRLQRSIRAFQSEI